MLGKEGLEASPVLPLGAEDSPSHSGHPSPVRALRPGTGPPAPRNVLLHIHGDE